MGKRIFDILASLVFLIIFSPFLVVISILIFVSSKGGVFFVQERIGKHGISFGLIKFRTMKPNAHQSGLLTIGKDIRITRVGAFLRKYKLDEIPQIFNILKGDMSIVGPRPEVKKYVDLYNKEQLKVLLVKPGLTDLASIQYIQESELLGKSSDPEKTYIEQIMPQKLALNLEYINKSSLLFDLQLIFKTIGKIVS